MRLTFLVIQIQFQAVCFQMTRPRIFWEPLLVKAVKSKKLILLTESLKFVLGFLLLFSQATKILQSQSLFSQWGYINFKVKFDFH